MGKNKGNKARNKGLKNGGGKSYIKVDQSGKRVTTFGDEIIDHVKAIDMEYAKYTKMRDSIQAYLTAPTFLQPWCSWEDRRFLYLTITPYCSEKPTVLVPAEFSAVVWSLKDGIIEKVTSLIDPGQVPYGRLFEVQDACLTNALPMPGEFQASNAPSGTPKSFFEGLTRLSQSYGFYIKVTEDKSDVEDEDQVLEKILIFTTKADEPMVNCCLKWLRNAAVGVGVTPPDLELYHFETLIRVMSMQDGNEESMDGVINHEGGAARFIYHPRYDFYPELACDWHQRDENIEKVSVCANNVSMRRVYNAIHYLCHLFRFTIPKPTHAPHGIFNFAKENGAPLASP